MKKAKKALSVALSIVVMATALFCNTIPAYADMRESFNYAQTIELNTTYTNILSRYDYRDEDGNYYNTYYFVIPYRGRATITLTTDTKRAIYHDCGVFPAVNLGDNKKGYDINDIKYDRSSGKYIYSLSFSIGSGDYYFYLRGADRSAIDLDYYTININYNAFIATPSNFVAPVRNTNDLKLKWDKIADINGYQIQKKENGAYKTLAYTTSNTYTVNKLSSSTVYTFRVRAYKKIDGKRYYSSWKVLNTPTKPKKVSIKAPQSNKNHQIIVKWNKAYNASGYQVQFCKNRECESVVGTKDISDGTRESYTGKKFTPGKTYYVRVRAYKSANGKRYYGAWSNVKAIKCK